MRLIDDMHRQWPGLRFEFNSCHHCKVYATCLEWPPLRLCKHCLAVLVLEMQISTAAPVKWDLMIREPNTAESTVYLPEQPQAQTVGKIYPTLQAALDDLWEPIGPNLFRRKNGCRAAVNS